VKSKVSGANFGCLKLALPAVVLGIILPWKKLDVIKIAPLRENIEKCLNPDLPGLKDFQDMLK
jgi:hypothetical protein